MIASFFFVKDDDSIIVKPIYMNLCYCFFQWVAIKNFVDKLSSQINSSTTHLYIVRKLRKVMDKVYWNKLLNCPYPKISIRQYRNIFLINYLKTRRELVQNTNSLSTIKNGINDFHLGIIKQNIGQVNSTILNNIS